VLAHPGPVLEALAGLATDGPLFEAAARSALEAARALGSRLPQAPAGAFLAAGGGAARVTLTPLAAAALPPGADLHGEAHALMAELPDGGKPDCAKVAAFTARCALLAAAVAAGGGVDPAIAAFVARNLAHCATGYAFRVLSAAGPAPNRVKRALAEALAVLAALADDCAGRDPTAREDERATQALALAEAALAEANEPAVTGEFVAAALAGALEFDLFFSKVLRVGRAAVAYAIRFALPPLRAGIPEMLSAWFRHQFGDAYTVDVAEAVLECFDAGAN
jgi:hypothetical protein